jgi:hypothetical protein
MTNDAKLGLVIGVAIVLVIALVFFRHDTAVAKMSPDQGRATTALTKGRTPSTQIFPRQSQ